MNQIKFKAWSQLHQHWIPQEEALTLTPLMEDPAYEWFLFTGLLDKHGEEIYEGDVVNYHDGQSEWGTFKVEAVPGGFQAVWLSQHTQTPSVVTPLIYLGCAQELERVMHEQEWRKHEPVTD